MSKTIERLSGREWLGLVIFIALCLSVSALGGAVTAANVGTWYQSLDKPWFTPPNWLFAPVWTLLYFAIAVAGWRVWRACGFASARAAMAAYAIQLTLNCAWSFIFFGGHMIGLALADIVLLLTATCVNTALFWRIDRAAGWLLTPYAAWVAFATILNFALWSLN